MTMLVFVHGWGLDGSAWNALRQALGRTPDRPPDRVVELGFRGPAPDTALPADRPLVGIGHSLGFQWLLGRLAGAQWRGLVAVNGFARFTRAAGFPDGVAPRLVERMAARLAGDPAAITAEFLRRCGGACDGQGLRPDRLAAGLERLAHGDRRAELAGWRGPLLALAGQADPIVAPAMTAATFEGRAIGWHPGGHLLPLSDPGWCAQRIAGFVAGLA